MAADSISNYLSMANYYFLAKVPWIQPAVIVGFSWLLDDRGNG